MNHFHHDMEYCRVNNKSSSMKKKILTMVCLLTGIFLQKFVDAQVDPHFSQYYLHPMTMNPALTGAIEGDYRVSSIWRSQYNNTLTTTGISGEMVTNKNANFGFNLLNQATNDKAYSYTNAYLSMAFTGVRFGPNADHYLVMALQCGMINRRFDVTKLQFGDQWVSGLGYDPSITSGEAFNKPSIYSFDAGAGIAYYDATPNKKVSLFGGFSAFHITRPDYPFLSDMNEQRLPVRYCVQAGLRIIASDMVSVVPSAIFMKEGDAEEKMIGAYVQLYASETTDLMFGANWRWQDAAVPFVGVYYKGLTFGLSYDVNISSMSTGASVTRSNSFEVSISYVGLRKSSIKTKKFYCPRF
jgi:type IX secretion system PorP/SprF family membrane protein